MKTGYRYNAADIHSHVLPGCDDGAGDVRESLEMLRADREEGVLDVIATPHYGIENGYAPKAGAVREAFETLRRAAAPASAWGRKSTARGTRRNVSAAGRR